MISRQLPLKLPKGSPPHTPRSYRRYDRTAPPPLEVRTHIALADTLKLMVNRNKWEWTHLPFGGKRSKATGALLQRMGVRPGWPDFVFINWTGAHHYLELKRGKATLSDHQDSFFAAMKARGVECAEAHSYAEAIDILARWGVVPISLKDAVA